jgi:alcohol dehydrogenase class IV
MAFISNQFVFGIEGDLISIESILNEYLLVRPEHLLVVADSGLHSVLEVPVLSGIGNNFRVSLYKVPSGEPTTDEADKLTELIRRVSPEVIIAIGGGSTIDLAKAATVLAKEVTSQKASDLQGKTLTNQKGNLLIAIPTTCGAGAEATKSAVLTNKHKKIKRGINSQSALPNVVILDAELLSTLPQIAKNSSFLDALTHSMESSIGKKRNLLSSMFSESAFKTLVGMVEDPKGLAIENKSALIASHFAGKAICNSETGPVHALSYYLSEELEIPHGIAVGVLLPEVIDYYTTQAGVSLKLDSITSTPQLIRLLKQIRNLAIPLLSENMRQSLVELDIEKASKRSMQLAGAIDNAPIVWDSSKSEDVYEKLVSSLR